MTLHPGSSRANIRASISSFSISGRTLGSQELDEKQPRKSGDTVFPIITLSVTMETSVRI